MWFRNFGDTNTVQAVDNCLRKNSLHGYCHTKWLFINIISSQLGPDVFGVEIRGTNIFTRSAQVCWSSEMPGETSPQHKNGWTFYRHYERGRIGLTCGRFSQWPFWFVTVLDVHQHNEWLIILSRYTKFDKFAELENIFVELVVVDNWKDRLI